MLTATAFPPHLNSAVVRDICVAVLAHSAGNLPGAASRLLRYHSSLPTKPKFVTSSEKMLQHKTVKTFLVPQQRSSVYMEKRILKKDKNLIGSQVKFVKAAL